MLDVMFACFFGFLLIPAVVADSADAGCGSAAFPICCAVGSVALLTLLLVLHFWNSENEKPVIEMSLKQLDLSRVTLPIRRAISEQCTVL
jgi:hypothetical protein